LGRVKTHTLNGWIAGRNHPTVAMLDQVLAPLGYRLGLLPRGAR
jgi:hypothetical protein